MGEERDLLSDVAEAFEGARDRPAAPTEASSGRTYADLFQATLQSRLGEEEWGFFGACVGRREAALQDAREGRLDRSEEGFAELWETRSRAAMSPAARLLLEVFLCAGKAYLRFRQGRFDAARRLLLRGSALDHVLATEHDLPLMSAHRLQLAHNLVRAYGREGNLAAAVEVTAGFLDYLEFRSEDIPAELASPRELLDAVPETIPAHYFDRISSEVALLLAGRADGETARLFRPLAHHAGAERCRGTLYGEEAHDWLRCKALLLEGRTEAFFEAASRMIRAGRRSEPLLWFAVILDVIGACRGGGVEAVALGGKLARETAALPDAPYALRNLTVAA